MGLRSGLNFIAIFLMLAAPNARAAESRLFLIHSYAPNSWTKGIREGILSQKELQKLPLKEYYFDSDFWGKKGSLGDANDEALNAFISEILPDDFLIISDDEASSVVLPKLKVSVKTMIVGINGSSQSKEWNSFCEGPKNRAIVFEDYPYEKALSLAQKRFPKLTKVNAIGGDTTTSRKMIQDLKEFLSDKSTALSETITSNAWSTWRSKLEEWNVPSNISWIFVPYGLRDSMNEEIQPEMASKWIATHTKNTMIGAFALGDGMDITVGLNPVDLGREAGKLAAEIMSGSKVKCRNPSQSYKIAITSRRTHESH